MEDSMSLKPLGDRVIIEAAEKEEKTASGIILTDSAQEKPQRGKVISVGRGRYENGQHIEMEVKAGDEIIYGKYSGSEVKLEDKTYLIMKESEILAIVS
jgi:chaperonin GroES